MNVNPAQTIHKEPKSLTTFLDDHYVLQYFFATSNCWPLFFVGDKLFSLLNLTVR